MPHRLSLLHGLFADCGNSQRVEDRVVHWLLHIVGIVRVLPRLQVVSATRGSSSFKIGTECCRWLTSAVSVS